MAKKRDRIVILTEKDKMKRYIRKVIKYLDDKDVKCMDEEGFDLIDGGRDFVEE